MTVWEQYKNSLQERPLVTKSSTAGVLNALQEIIALAVTGSRGYDKALKMSMYGFFISAPLGHVLYAKMEELLKDVSGPRATIAKVLVSNVLITPILTGLYLVALAKFAGLSLGRSIMVARGRLGATMKVAWIINPIFQAFAFKNLDPSLWLPFFNFVSFMFGTFLNIQSKLEAKKRDAAKKDEAKAN